MTHDDHGDDHSAPAAPVPLHTHAHDRGLRHPQLRTTYAARGTRYRIDSVHMFA